MSWPSSTTAHYRSLLARQKRRASVLRPLPSPVIHPTWFVVFTEPRAEDKAAEHLGGLGYEVYLPKEVVWARIPEHRRQPGGPKKLKVEKPLFPRYVFVGCEPDKHSLMPARMANGVVDLVKTGVQALRVPGSVISRLSATVASGDHDRTAQEAADLARLLGSQVVIASGLFTGFAATVLRIARRDVEVEVESGPNRMKLKLSRDALGV